MQAAKSRRDVLTGSVIAATLTLAIAFSGIASGTDRVSGVTDAAPSASAVDRASFLESNTFQIPYNTGDIMPLGTGAAK